MNFEPVMDDRDIDVNRENKEIKAKVMVKESGERESDVPSYYVIKDTFERCQSKIDKSTTMYTARQWVNGEYG